MRKHLFLFITSIIICVCPLTYCQNGVESFNSIISKNSKIENLKIPSSPNINNQLLVELLPETNTTVFFSDLEKKFPNTQHSIVSKSFNIYKIVVSSKVTVDSIELKNLSTDNSLLTTAIHSFLKNNKNVVGVSYNALVSPRGTTPNDSLYNQQYYLPKTSVPQLWDITQGGTTACGDTIVVAVIDRGFDLKIKDFSGNIYQNNAEIPNNGIDDDGNGYIDDYQGYNFYSMNDNHDNAQFDGDQYHGNECAGIIGARGNNITGISGINWQTKMLFLSASRSVEYVIGAYDYAYKMRKLYNDTKGVKGAFIAVTSCSLGIDGARPEDNLPFCNVYDKLGQVGILNVVAATNMSGDLYTIGDVPGLCKSDYLIVVNSTDANDKLANFSPTSTTYIGISAPGTDILSTEPLKYVPQFQIDSGNSFAAPQVAGVAALLYSISDTRLCPKNFVSPSDATLKIKNAIYKGADKINSLSNASKTGGRLNALNSYKALQILLPTVETPTTNYELRIAPNPTDGIINCQLIFDGLRANNNYQLSPINYQLYDNLGRVLIQKQLTAPMQFTIDCSAFPPSIYFLRCETVDGVITKKIIVNH